MLKGDDKSVEVVLIWELLILVMLRRGTKGFHLCGGGTQKELPQS